MSNKPPTSEEVAGLAVGLNRLARNLWWTWNQQAQEIFQELSARAWQNLYHNAVAILHEGIRLRVARPLAGAVFRAAGARGVAGV